MECNRDEAFRAKSIAEGKLEKNDFAGAKKFALKAQTLYPGLEGISQILTTLDVYVSAENKISGEVDWYGVLGVNPSADEEIIRKQYRKLALMLHPDKNKSVGAEGAFKLISEAWTLLSDKAKRLAYNQRRGSKGFQQKVPMHSGGPSASSRANGFYNFASRTTSTPKTQGNYAKVPSAKVPPAKVPPAKVPPAKVPPAKVPPAKVPPAKVPMAKVPPAKVPPPSCYKRTDTFWTICHRCKMHYEYLKKYLNHTLLCPNCQEAFMASETAPPVKFSKSSNAIPRQRQQNSSDHIPSRNSFDSERNAPVAQKSRPGQASLNLFRYANQKDPIARAASVGSTDPSITAKAADVVQQAQDTLKRQFTESHGSAGWEEYVKKRKLDDDRCRYGMNYNMTQGNGGVGSSSASALGSRIYGFSGNYCQPNSIREMTPMESRNMLLDKTQKEIVKKLNEWRAEATAKAANNEKDKAKEIKKEKRRSISNVQGQDQDKDCELAASKIPGQEEKLQVSHFADTVSKDDSALALMNVPDPDFHDFDQDRTETSFGDNEVWATYDDDDGMPRFYALISKVISRKPFKLRISWLNSKTNREFSPIEWVGSGFYKTSGEFWVGRYETCKSINSFSQKVNWSKSPRGSILIFPQKGDVWALYKNWSSDWNENTPSEDIHKYNMVMVLDDYSEEQGVSVSPLVKVVGFKTVFHPNLDPEKFKKIPKEEMFRFSHRVPNHLLTGLEAQNAPKGCLELDPAATPLELLQVLTEANEVPILLSRENFSEEAVQNVQDTSLNEIADGTK